MGVAFVSFAGNPKGDLKPNTETTSPTTNTSTAGTNYYWFDVTADGTALADNLGIPLSQDAEPSGECQGLAEDFCQRGYTEAQTTISGGRRYVNIAVDQSASEDHKQ